MSVSAVVREISSFEDLSEASADASKSLNSAEIAVFPLRSRSVRYQSNQQTGGRRLVGLAIVAVLHVILISTLVHALAHKSIPVPPSLLEVKLLQEKEAKPDLPPPPPPKLVVPPPAFVPLPDIQVQTAAPAPIAVVSNTVPTEAARPTAAPAPVLAKPVVVPAVIDPSKTCEQPQYPLVSRDAGEEGAVMLLFLVDTDGKVLASKVEKSSGYSRLDDAALSSLSKCHFVPATVDGKPQQTKARLRYVWHID